MLDDGEEADTQMIWSYLKIFSHGENNFARVSEGNKERKHKT